MAKLPRALPDAQYLRSIFEYDAETGVLRWRHRPDRAVNWNVRYAGKVAGALNGKGYIHVLVNGAFIEAHRIAWVMHHGSQAPFEVDHKDGCRSHNAIDNLRAATTSQNRMNMRSRGQWPKGVYRYDRDGSFRAQIKLNGKTQYLGMFKTPELAHQAYAARAAVLFKEFACLDR